MGALSPYKTETSSHLPPNSSCRATMLHTPPVPSPIQCPDSSCKRVFMHRRDLNVHSHVHAQVREDLQLRCPSNGCSFKALQLKLLEAHVDVAHREQPRQFQCFEDNCGFSTTTQGALTRHYRERHHIEPPGIVVRKPASRRRTPKTMYDDQRRPSVASTSHLPAPPILPVSHFSSARSSASVSGITSGPPAASSASLHSPSIPEIHKHYRGTVYSAPAAGRPKGSAGTEAICPPAEPRGDPYLYQPTRLCSARARTPSPSCTAEWVSWRDEDFNVAQDIIAIATGERQLCERNMLGGMTEYLPVPGDIGMAEKRFLWA
ncbi:hypothetical protein DFH06DRAFT_527828 [Mycena polygramma]|nr:hypothetical protein DFH06DRAFT_527828 [Mycena polygramma]